MFDGYRHVNFKFNTLSRHLGELLHRLLELGRGLGQQLLLRLDHDADLMIFMHRSHPHAHGRAGLRGFLDLRGSKSLHVDIRADLVDDLRGATASRNRLRALPRRVDALIIMKTASRRRDIVETPSSQTSS